MKIVILIGLVVAILGVIVLLLRNNSSQTSESAERTTAQNDSVKKQNWLQGTAGEVGGKNYHIGQRSVTIGRAPTNFVQIMDTNVSRFHVRLTPTAHGLDVQDMNSSTGTKINNNAINKATLKSGDTLTIGNASFVYHKEANFGVNEGLVGRKAVGGDSIKPTMMEENGAELDALVVKVLGQCNGDTIKAAQITNLSVDVVESIKRKYKGKH